jgi:TolB-like protein/tetratricopeptide (TPR) repeat protein
LLSWKELKERRLVQIVISYAVAGWVVVSIIGEVIDRGVLPELLYRVLLVLYFGGMLIALITGWYHGEKGQQAVTRLEVFLVALVALGTLGVTGWVIQGHRTQEARLAAGEAAGLQLRTVAVLYFRDQSRGDDLSYLADGLTETLIDQLSESRGLTVLTRSASAQFRDSTLPIDSIAKVLGAGTVVDGTVEQRGDRIRVNVSLLDGASGVELNRDLLERPAQDVFALQEDLAREVSARLRGWVGEEIQLRQVRRGTDDVTAWTLFQRGERRREDGESALRSGNSDDVVREFRAADSLYAEAELADPRWASPLSRRASLAARWAQISFRREPQQAESWLNAGLQYANRALALDPRSADAHFARGSLEFFRWSRGLVPSASGAAAAYEQAQSDLEQATRLDSRLAEAWNLLSVIYSEKPDIVGANLAARRALEADEFSRNASEVLLRLYATSYDLENIRDAAQYCDQGRRRFPANPSFRECRLWLLSAPLPQAPTPDPDEAWRALEEYLRVVPPQFQEFEVLKGHILVAGALARAQLTDSARAVLSRSRSTPAVDPEMELLGLEALVRLHHMDEPEEALTLLRTYLTSNPSHREGWQWTAHWWWRPLQGNPEFRALVEG